MGGRCLGDTAFACVERWRNRKLMKRIAASVGAIPASVARVASCNLR